MSANIINAFLSNARQKLPCVPDVSPLLQGTSYAYVLSIGGEHGGPWQTLSLPSSVRGGGIGFATDRYLFSTDRQQANLCSTSAVHVVLGNESCDLDSAISALVYGLLIAEETKTDGNIAVLPVLNIPRADVPLKTEVVHFLQQNCIQYNDIPCRDEVDLQSLHREGKLSLSLVDHHQLFGNDLALVPSICQILDHRTIVAEALADLPSSAKATIKPVGSCCTLVAQEVLARKPSLLSACVATLLKGTILLDTVCFSAEADRTTPQDVAVVEQCEKAERRELFQSLLIARKDVSKLTPSQLLRKDIKVVDGLPVPGMPELVADFAKREGVKDALIELCERHQSPVAVVIGMIVDETSGAVTRDIAVFEAVQGAGKADRLKTKLLEEENFQLQLVISPISELTLYRQGNVKVTRKHILPVIRSVL